MPTPLRLTKPALADNLTLFLTLVDVLGDRHDLPAEDRHALRLLVEEACTNVVRHAYPEGEPGRLTLELSFGDGFASIRVEDGGVPFAPADVPSPVLDDDWQRRPEGGLGWHLIRSHSDEIAYERLADSNRLTLRKRLSAP